MHVMVIGAVRFPDGDHVATGYCFAPPPGFKSRVAVVDWLVSAERATQITNHLTSSEELLFEEVPILSEAVLEIRDYLQSRSWILFEQELWTAQAARHYPTFPAHLKVADAFAALASA